MAAHVNITHIPHDSFWTERPGPFSLIERCKQITGYIYKEINCYRTFSVLCTSRDCMRNYKIHLMEKKSGFCNHFVTLYRSILVWSKEKSDITRSCKRRLLIKCKSYTEFFIGASSSLIPLELPCFLWLNFGH